MSPRPSFLFSARSRRIGVVSTYPPKLCGLATFAAALEGALVTAGHRVDVVRLDDGLGPVAGSRVLAVLANGKPGAVRQAALALSACEVVLLQHEYGIYGGADGDEVLELLDALASIRVPTIVTLHTVPIVPTTHQREVLAEVVARADGVVVMSVVAKDRLEAVYPVDMLKVSVVPHGASVVADDPIDLRDPTSRGAALSPKSLPPQLLTWGLLGPGKGIEHVIDALALLQDLSPRPQYKVAGVTHPNVLSRDGDAYRNSLIARTFAKRVAGSVTFDASYRDVEALTRFVRSSTFVVLPYDSRDQVTSGVLVDAIAAGRPVIATEFPHAVELLSSGAGMVVPHGNPVALADAIRLAVTDDELLASMAAEAKRLAPSLSWSAVAGQYLSLIETLRRASEPAAEPVAI